MKTRNKLVALMLIFATMFLCVGVTANQVDAATSRKTIYYASANLVMRKSDSSDSKNCGTLKKNQRVVKFKSAKNGYALVWLTKYNEKRKCYELYGRTADVNPDCLVGVYVCEKYLKVYATRTVDMNAYHNLKNF